MITIFDFQYLELKEDATYYVNDDENDEEQYLYTEADVQGIYLRNLFI